MSIDNAGCGGSGVGKTKEVNSPKVKNSTEVGKEAHIQLESDRANEWIPEETIKLPCSGGLKVAILSYKKQYDCINKFIYLPTKE